MSIGLSDQEMAAQGFRVSGARGATARTPGLDLAVEVDTVDQKSWGTVCRQFVDANLYQTWSYEVVRSGRPNVSHLLLKQGATMVAAVQARLLKAPLLGAGLAYIVWGPLFRMNDGPADAELFRQSLRAIRAEYIGRRKLGVRIVPRVEDTEKAIFRAILEEEGFVHHPQAKLFRTLIVDLRPAVDELQTGLHQKWRYHLKKARAQNLELISGEEDALFGAFDSIYRQMVSRKGLEDVTDVSVVRAIQQKLMPDEKMRVFLCKQSGNICAGGICSSLGSTGIYLYGATSDLGIKTYSSYLVHWNMLEWIKRQGCRWYDLNGINPVKNPGGYQFKAQLAGTNGREIQWPGQFNAYPNRATKILVSCGELIRTKLRRCRATRTRHSS